jgi:hypothetical protein
MAAYFQGDIGESRIQRCAIIHHPVVHQVLTGQQTGTGWPTGRGLAVVAAKQAAFPGQSV